MKQSSTQQLLQLISNMKPIEFVGLGKLLGVQLLTEEKEPRPFADVLEDVLTRFEALSRTRKREIIKLVKKSQGK